jgi:hypothetical protein
MQLNQETYDIQPYKRLDNRPDAWRHRQEMKYLLAVINRPDHAKQYKAVWGITPYERLKALEKYDS